jgi:hypothetical protein
MKRVLVTLRIRHDSIDTSLCGGLINQIRHREKFQFVFNYARPLLFFVNRRGKGCQRACSCPDP